MKSRFRWLGAALFVLGTAGAFGQQDALLAAIDVQASYLGVDFSGEYTIVQKKTDQGETSTTLAVFRRDSEDKYVLVFLKPEADKGKGILRIGNNLWKYDPISRRFDVSSAKDRLQNTNARFSDFNASTLEKDYKLVAKTSEKLGKLDTTVVTLDARNDEVTFPRIKLWVTADKLIRKREDFSLSGQLLRTTAIPAYTKIGVRSVPNNVIILDELSGERTLITVANPRFEKLGELIFSQAYLEKLRR